MTTAINYSIEEYDQDGVFQSISYIQNEEKLKQWILSNKMNRASYNKDGILSGIDWAIDVEYLEEIQDRKSFLQHKVISKFPLLVSDTVRYYVVKPFSFTDDIFFN